jgi:uncharacterized protein (DUF2141 family)
MRPAVFAHVRAAGLLALPLLVLTTAAANGQQRDAPAQAAVPGTAVILGQVVTDEATPRPIRQAVVTLAGDLPASRGAVTNDRGEFVFAGLPAGRFTVSVKKPAYLATSYGALRPGRPGVPIALAQGQRVTIAVTLARGAVISGAVRDSSGRALAGVQVSAQSTRSTTTSTPPAGSSVTDDLGQYRIYGLAAGEYVIAAKPSVRGTGPIAVRPAAEVDALLAEIARRHTSSPSPTPGVTPRQDSPIVSTSSTIAYAPVFYPATPLQEEATPVRVATGEERPGVDISVAPVGVVTLEGAVSGPLQHLGAAQLTIFVPGRQTMSSQDANPVLVLRPGVDGRFKYTNLAPGHYTIMARADPAQTTPLPAAPAQMSRAGDGLSGPAKDYLYGVTDVDVRGEDVAGLSISLQPGSTFSGRVTFDGTAAPPADLSKVTLSLRPPGGSSMMQMGDTIVGNSFSSPAPIAVTADGSFATRGIAPGRYLIVGPPAATLGTGWSLRSVMLNGRDLLDEPLVVMPGQTLADVMAVFSDKHSELMGSLVTGAGTAAPQYVVVAFPTDRALWRPDSRRVGSARPGSDGHFSLRDLPPGEYFIAALTDVDATDLGDPKFLEQVVPAALKVTLADGERKAQDLRIAGR